jgi:5-formyltetrahydrofolate cyclo-ligase
VAKSDLRAQLRLRRRELSATHPDAGERAAAQLPLEQLAPFAVVSGSRPLAGEIDPWPVLRKLKAAGARLVLPVAVNAHSPLVFRAYEEGDPLEPDASRTPAPSAQAPELVPDLVIAPLLAFDRSGYRLGLGAGYYDRTLAALRRQGTVWVIGLAYAGQELDPLPIEPHDEPLDAILTENGYHVARK